MSITERIDPKDYSDITDFLLAHEMKNIAMKLLVEFVREVAENFSLAQSNEAALRKLVEFEAKANALLDQLGEK